MYDIIIAGLGPAGAVLAAALDKRFSVLCMIRFRAHTERFACSPSDR